jgi:hypothetical protein
MFKPMDYLMEFVKVLKMDYLMELLKALKRPKEYQKVQAMALRI